MLIRKSRNVLRAIFIGSLLLALPYGSFAQDQTQSAGKQSAKKNKANADSCDGALDIVPGKPMTFTRKRRPSKPEVKPEAKSETKSETKSEARPEVKPGHPNPSNPVDVKDAKQEKQRGSEYQFSTNGRTQIFIC
jgi:hypothetical protein